VQSCSLRIQNGIETGIASVIKIRDAQPTTIIGVAEQLNLPEEGEETDLPPDFLTEGAAPGEISQKRNGRFCLIFWQDAVSYDLSERTDTKVPGRELTLVFLKPVRLAKLYRPSTQPSPVEQVDNVTRIGLSVPDHLLVVELEF
jgi:hypothetical protein